MFPSFFISANSDSIFNNEDFMVSFRYPSDWTEQKAQLDSTLILIYASDGSDSTCNLNVGIFSDLDNLSEEELEKYRRSNHTRESFEEQFKDKFTDLKITDYWRGYLGQKYAGFAEYQYSLFISDNKIAVTSYVGATFANGKRYVLTCNAPTGKENSTKETFEYIRNTMLFTY